MEQLTTRKPLARDFTAKTNLIRANWAGRSAKIGTWTINERGGFGYDASLEGKKDGLYSHCSLTSFLLKCGHSERSYQLDVLNDKANLNGGRGIQVISKPGQPDVISIKHVGSCGHKKENCPSLVVSKPHGSKETIKNTTHQLEVFSRGDKYEDEGFLGFLKTYLAPNVNAFGFNEYILDTQGCSELGSHSATIHAFPSFKWEGEISLGYSDANRSDASKINQWELAGKIACNIGKSNFNYEGKKNLILKDVFPSLQDALDEVLGMISDVSKDATSGVEAIGGAMQKDTGVSAASLRGTPSDGKKDDSMVKTTFKPPAVSLGGSLELFEVQGSNEVDLEGKVSLNLNPLLEVTLETDILEWVILGASSAATPAGPKLGKFLIKAKRWAAENKVVIAVILDVKGAIKAGLEWKKGAGQSWAVNKSDTTGNVGLGITFGIKAIASVETTLWRVTAKAGVELSLKGAEGTGEGIGFVFSLFATTENDKPGLGGNVKFTGAAVYFAYYAEASIKESSSKPAPQATGRQSASQSGNSAAESEHKTKEEELRMLYQIVGAKTWSKAESSSDATAIPISDVS